MADPDRTERRLLDSIRKAKASSRPIGSSPPAGASGQSGAPATGTQSRPAAAKRVVRETEARPSAPAPGAENYQAGRRIWPD